MVVAFGKQEWEYEELSEIKVVFVLIGIWITQMCTFIKSHIMYSKYLFISLCLNLACLHFSRGRVVLWIIYLFILYLVTKYMEEAYLQRYTQNNNLKYISRQTV